MLHHRPACGQIWEEAHLAKLYDRLLHLSHLGGVQQELCKFVGREVAGQLVWYVFILPPSKLVLAQDLQPDKLVCADSFITVCHP